MTAPDAGSSKAPTPRVRPRSVYQTAYVWAALGLGWLLVSGRLTSYWHAFRPGTSPANVGDPTDLFLTGVLYLVFLLPLLLLAYDLGSQSVEARPIGTSTWVGLRESWLLAWRHPDLNEMAAEFAEPPRDEPGAALVYGILVAAAPITLFLQVMPALRNGPGILWIGGAGAFMGIAAYCYRRAAVYLRRDPGRWSMTRGWSLLNPNRYEAAGRPFVSVQIACTILLPIWWLYGASLLPQ